MISFGIIHSACKLKSSVRKRIYFFRQPHHSDPSQPQTAHFMPEYLGKSSTTKIHLLLRVISLETSFGPEGCRFAPTADASITGGSFAIISLNRIMMRTSVVLQKYSVAHKVNISKLFHVIRVNTIC